MKTVGRATTTGRATIVRGRAIRTCASAELVKSVIDEMTETARRIGARTAGPPLTPWQ
jgi:hypothetical protein